MFANEISVIANVIPKPSASWEISLEYDGNPPVARPITKPLATIVGKFRHGRNTRLRDGLVLKSLPTHTLARNAPSKAMPMTNFCGKLNRISILGAKSGRGDRAIEVGFLPNHE